MWYVVGLCGVCCIHILINTIRQYNKHNTRNTSPRPKHHTSHHQTLTHHLKLTNLQSIPQSQNLKKMKTTTILSLAATAATTALAAPSNPRAPATTCQFGTYRCTIAPSPNTGIEICNVLGQWELVGPCPAGTSCSDLPQNGFTLPFCTAVTGAAEKRNGRPGQSPGERCDVAGKYQCFGPYAIQVCDTQNVLQFVGNCPERSHCDYLGGVPFCVASV